MFFPDPKSCFKHENPIESYLCSKHQIQHDTATTTSWSCKQENLSRFNDFSQSIHHLAQTWPTQVVYRAMAWILIWLKLRCRSCKYRLLDSAYSALYLTCNCKTLAKCIFSLCPLPTSVAVPSTVSLRVLGWGCKGVLTTLAPNFCWDAQSSMQKTPGRATSTKPFQTVPNSSKFATRPCHIHISS